MTDGTDFESTAGTILARQAAISERMFAIVDAPEAEGRENVAFALACRQDIPAQRARALLAEAPELSGVENIAAWVNAVPARPPLEIVK